MATILIQRAAARDASHRYTRALELLGDCHLTQRLAGIYALEGLLREAAGEGLENAIIEVFSAFVRRQASLGEGIAPHRIAPRRIAADVQAALTALGRSPNILLKLDTPLDLHGIGLREAVLPHCYFERAFLYDCDFEGALLVGAQLRGAWLARANLTRANLDGADLRGADLTGALGVFPDKIEGAQWDAETRWPRARDFARASVMEGSPKARNFQWDPSQSTDPDA